MRNLLVLFAVCLVLSGCMAYRDFEKGLAKGKEILTTGAEMVAKGKEYMDKAQSAWQQVKAHAEKADTNKDGKVDWGEAIAYLTAAATAAGGALVARNAKSNARKSILEDRVARLEEVG